MQSVSKGHLGQVTFFSLFNRQNKLVEIHLLIFLRSMELEEPNFVPPQAITLELFRSLQGLQPLLILCLIR